MLYPERVTLISGLPVSYGNDGLLIAPVHSYATLRNADGFDYSTTVQSNIDIYGTPILSLPEPPTNWAWDIKLRQASNQWHRVVIFHGDNVSWDDVSDVNPGTLTPVPVDEALAEWIAVRDAILQAIDIPDPVLNFENGLI